ncbi:hypothetical protein GOBAR_AA05149 [Gossypium barbadense]|uniref:Uncharacterized protein n=1 Tax=Gossypium barbadense TaxID=3634 RepID=A0A2P5YIL5_GOSBA|nr:hypothetical protein GOBAR_AA05149 [Gossypium barbadense]
MSYGLILRNNQHESGGGYSGGGRGRVPQMLRQKNIISQVGYGRGRAGHGSRGEPFLVEFRVTEYYRRMNWVRGWWWLRWWVLMTGRDIISNVLGILLFGGLGEAILKRVGSSALLDHPYTKHAQDALWGHMSHESEGG